MVDLTKKKNLSQYDQRAPLADDGDYLELWVENNTSATDITVVDMNLIAEALN